MNVTELLSHSVVCSGAAMLFPRLAEVLQCLRRHVDDNCRTRQKWEATLKGYENVLSGKGKSAYLAIGLVVLGVAAWGLATSTHWFATESFAYGYDIWSSQSFLTGFLVRAFYELLVYGVVIPYVLFKLLTILYIMRRSCLDWGRELKLRPLNSDQAGGLGAFGEFSLGLTFVAAFPIALIVVYLFFVPVNTLFLTLSSVYIILLVVLFFYPLGGVHRAMRDAKNSTLSAIALQINRRYDNLLGTSPSDIPLRIDAEFDRLDKLYLRAREMPVWPFNHATFTQFLVIVGTPTVTILLKLWEKL